MSKTQVPLELVCGLGFVFFNKNLNGWAAPRNNEVRTAVDGVLIVVVSKATQPIAVGIQRGPRLSVAGRSPCGV